MSRTLQSDAANGTQLYDLTITDGIKATASTRDELFNHFPNRNAYLKEHEAGQDPLSWCRQVHSRSFAPPTQTSPCEHDRTTPEKSKASVHHLQCATRKMRRYRPPAMRKLRYSRHPLFDEGVATRKACEEAAERNGCSCRGATTRPAVRPYHSTYAMLQRDTK